MTTREDRRASSWRRLALAVTLAALPGLSAATPDPAAPGLEAARRLTWDRATRGRGIEALRALVAADPRAIEPRFELGRVLTWDPGTRAEGIAVLRDTARAAPERDELIEALAEVLSWDRGTRNEAIDLLGGVLARRPERSSSALLLAEILSWDPARRSAAEALIRGVLRREPGSIPARLALARLARWRGDPSEARRLYDDVLARSPHDRDARLALAELDLAFGRSRDALAYLEALPAGAADTPAVHRQRAAIFEAMGRPARAAAGYRAVLAADPDDEAARRGLTRAEQDLDPRLNIGLDLATESGDPQTSKVRTAALPLRFTFHPGDHDPAVSWLGSFANYHNDSGSTTDVAIGIGFEAPVGNATQLAGDVVLHDFEQAGTEWSGELGARFHPSGPWTLRIGARRETLDSSRLSLGGEEVGGTLYGPVFADELFGAAAFTPGAWDVWARLAVAGIEGTAVQDNDRDSLFAGFGRTWRTGRLTLRPGWSLTYFSHDLDLGGFPPADLAGDGVNAPGVGGYFSPFRFLNQMIRLDLGLTLAGGGRFSAGAAVGRQLVDDALSKGYGAADTSAEAYADLTVPLADRLTLRARLTYQDVAAAFDRAILHLGLGIRF